MSACNGGYISPSPIPGCGDGTDGHQELPTEFVLMLKVPYSHTSQTRHHQSSCAASWNYLAVVSTSLSTSITFGKCKQPSKPCTLELGTCFQVLRLLDHNHAASVSAVRSLDDAHLVEPLLEALADRSASLLSRLAIKPLLYLILVPECSYAANLFANHLS